MKSYFPKVKEAREALREKALELFQLQVKIIEEAIIAKDFETAAKANQWLIEHMPKEDGETMVEGSVDNDPVGKQGQTGPSIQIGIALGGIPSHQKALPSPTINVIDVEPSN